MMTQKHRKNIVESTDELDSIGTVLLSDDLSGHYVEPSDDEVFCGEPVPQDADERRIVSDRLEFPQEYVDVCTECVDEYERRNPGELTIKELVNRIGDIVGFDTEEPDENPGYLTSEQYAKIYEYISENGDGELREDD